MRDSDERCLVQPLRVMIRGPFEKSHLLEHVRLKETVQSGPRLQEALGDWVVAYVQMVFGQAGEPFHQAGEALDQIEEASGRVPEVSVQVA